MKKKLLMIAAGIAAVLVMAYVVVSIFFWRRFSFHTYVNGRDVSLMTEAEVEEVFLSAAGEYALQIEARDGLSDVITARDIDLRPVFQGEIGTLIGDNSGFKWITSIFDDKVLEIPSVASFDEEKLGDAIASALFMQKEKMTPVEDARYEFDETQRCYAIIPEIQGSVPVSSRVLQVLTDSLQEMREGVSLDAEDCYETPTITSEDETLNATVTSLNRYAAMRLVYTFGDTQEVVDGSVIKEWLTLDGTQAILDEEGPKNYITTLARKYDTFGQTRQFHTSSGDDIEVQGGDYGWWMDRATTSQNLLDALATGESGELEPVYFAKAAQYGEQDYGDSYIEIDLDAQHVWVYKDGEMVLDTDCVSGKASAGNGTPEGTYGITYKTKDAVLRGQNYETPVKYWMPFNGNIGLHDASWRSNFGGKIYAGSGSHGCINLPPVAAQELYEYVEKGEAVIVYGGMSTEEARAYLKLGQETDEDAGADEEDANAEEDVQTQAGVGDTANEQTRTDIQATISPSVIE